MKINLTEELPAGKSNNYKKGEAEHAPQLIREMLQIDGIKGIYHVLTFWPLSEMPNTIGKRF